MADVEHDGKNSGAKYIASDGDILITIEQFKRFLRRFGSNFSCQFCGKNEFSILKRNVGEDYSAVLVMQILKNNSSSHVFLGVNCTSCGCVVNFNAQKVLLWLQENPEDADGNA